MSDCTMILAGVLSCSSNSRSCFLAVLSGMGIFLQISLFNVYILCRYKINLIFSQNAAEFDCFFSGAGLLTGWIFAYNKIYNKVKVMFSLPQKQAINAPYMRQRYRQKPSVSSSFLNNSTSNSKVSKILESRNMHYKRQPKIQKFEKKMRHSSVELRPNMLENSICPSIPSNRNDNRPHTSIASYRKSSFSERNITKANPFKICV